MPISSTARAWIQFFPCRVLVEDDSSSYSDYNSIGVRTVYNAANDSLIVYANNNTLVEYRLKDGAELARNTTQNNVFNLLKMDDVVVVSRRKKKTTLILSNSWTGDLQQNFPFLLKKQR